MLMIIIVITTILYKTNSQVSKHHKLTSRKLSRKQLAQGQLLARGTRARNSRKGLRKHMVQNMYSRKQHSRKGLRKELAQVNSRKFWVFDFLNKV